MKNNYIKYLLVNFHFHTSYIRIKVLIVLLMCGVICMMTRTPFGLTQIIICCAMFCIVENISAGLGVGNSLIDDTWNLLKPEHDVYYITLRLPIIKIYKVNIRYKNASGKVIKLRRNFIRVGRLGYDLDHKIKREICSEYLKNLI